MLKLRSGSDLWCFLKLHLGSKTQLRPSVKSIRDGLEPGGKVRAHDQVIRAGPELTSQHGVEARLTGMTVCSRPGETRKMISTWTAVWVKICASWAGLCLYLWTLVAPLLLPNRDFS